LGWPRKKSFVPGQKTKRQSRLSGKPRQRPPNSRRREKEGGTDQRNPIQRSRNFRNGLEGRPVPHVTGETTNMRTPTGWPRTQLLFPHKKPNSKQRRRNNPSVVVKKVLFPAVWLSGHNEPRGGGSRGFGLMCWKNPEGGQTFDHQKKKFDPWNDSLARV